MQNPQMAQMAMNANMGGPVDGTPVMTNAARGKTADDPRAHLNTYIYDYFKRNNHAALARLMIDMELSMNLNNPGGAKRSPGNRNVNGVDGMDEDASTLPAPNLPDHQLADNSFLMDWWCQFWDIWGAARQRSSNPRSMQYINHTRNIAQMQTDNRTNRMMMNGANMNQYQMMRAGMPNGVGGAPNPNDLKRTAAMNNRPGGANPMANMNQMKNQAMMSAQMQRDGSQMDMNGQRPQSPSTAENAPSPNKRPRVEGGMNPGMAGSQFNDGFGQQGQGLQQKTMEGLNAAVQGSPMNPQTLQGHDEIFAGNPQRPGMQAGAPGQPQGNHALQDYQMQLMLLEQQNKKRLLMARQEQDNMSGGPPHGQSAVGAPGYPPAMSPQGSRAGPSPNPTDQMKRGTPKLNQTVLPGSPMPDATMQQQRNSPAPNFNIEQMPPGMPPQFAYPQMAAQNQMMRPPSSHPGGFNGQQQMTPQQMEAMRQNGAMQNGAWRGGPPQAMMQNPGQQMGGPMNNAQQRNNMPPPPAPAGEPPRAQEPSPSQPAAPPTPSQSNKANPKKNNAKKDNKKPTKATKGANTGATPAASSEDPPPTPTPSTPVAPITPMHQNSFKGQPQNAPNAVQPPAAAPPPPPMDTNPPFGDLSEPNFGGFDGFDADNTLDNFDFDSFLHVGGDDPSGFGSLGGDFGFGDTVEAGGEI